jgi:hypothetical protein
MICRRRRRRRRRRRKKRKKKARQNVNIIGYNKSVALQRSQFLPHKQFVVILLNFPKLISIKINLFLPLICMVKYNLYFKKAPNRDF